MLPAPLIIDDAVTDDSTVGSEPECSRSPSYPNEAYEVGWISALPLELAAARGMLDEEHGPPQSPLMSTDTNSYVLGCMHTRRNKHNIVIACLPRGEVGASSAALVARDMLSSFPNIRIGLMVGIGAGIPCYSHGEGDGDDEIDVRLGDVVISSDKKTGGVVAYNFGKRLGDGSFEVAYHLDKPPRALRTALAGLEAEHEQRENLFPQYFEKMLQKIPERMRAKWTHPGRGSDVLFPSNYPHQGTRKSCDQCDRGKACRRNSDEPPPNKPAIHYGVIATGSEVVKHAPTRDQIRADHKAICLEMEAAGLMNNFPCVVIRGISDYADSHKNDRWHRYAAATAAACAKELLLFVRPSDVKNAPKATEVIGHLQDIESKLDGVDEEVKALNKTSQYDRIRRWLSAPDIDTNFNNALDKHYPGTCSWFLSDPRFKAWQFTPGQNLWIRGIPGSGKTIISAQVISTLQSEEAGSHPSTPLYFFFDTRDAQKQTFDSMVRSLVSQLYLAFKQTRSIFDALFRDTYDNGNKKILEKDLVAMFLKMVRSSGQGFKIILDALDECSTLEKVIEWAQNLSLQFQDLGFFVTSRDETLIESSLKDWINKKSFVALQRETINVDISSYVQQYTRQNFKRWNQSPHILTKIQEEVLKKANGMFRLASCQLDILQTCVDIGQIEDELRKLPTTLETIYDRILQKIQDQHQTRAIRILQFLVYSQRPLRIEELVDAATVDLSRQPEFEVSRRMPDPQGILEVCSSLLTRHARPDSDSNTQSETIELAHASVKDYLKALGENSKFYDIAHPSKAEGTITAVCLAYLSQLDEKQSRKQAEENFPFAKFSSRYWLRHAKESDALPEIRDSSIKFLSSNKTRELWAAFYNPDCPWEDSPSPYEMANPLYYASLAGLENTVEALFANDEGMDPEMIGGEYGNALQAASIAGHERVVEFLLDRGADPNTPGGLLGNALQAAATRGNERIIALLLGKGANINSEGGKYGNALQAASARGNHATTVFLLSNGANPNLQGGKYGNALYVASLRGYRDLARELLEKGASCNAESGHRGTALHAASEGGHVNIVSLLVQNNVNIDKKHPLYGNALQLATSRGHMSVARLLLESGSDPNVQGGVFGNSLQAASARGNEELVQLLLERGSDPNALGGYYRTALQACSVHGYTSAAALLLGGGAKVNIQGGEHKSVLFQDQSDNGKSQAEKVLQIENIDKTTQAFQNDSRLILQLFKDKAKPKIYHDPSENIQTMNLEPDDENEMELLRRLNKQYLQDNLHGNALEAASANGHEAMVKLLLDKDAEMRASGSIYGSALQAASTQGHESVVRLLLERGANPNMEGGFYGTALQAASARGHNRVVALLLQKGANPKAKQGAFKGTLPAAAARGNTTAVGLLLDKIDHLDVTGGHYQTALYAAASGGYREVVKLLLDRGKEMEMPPYQYINPLQAAVRLGYKDIVKMLLDVGADANIQMENGNHVLGIASSNGDRQMVKTLLEEGADVNMLDENASNALEAAVKGGFEAVVRLLLERGADINAQGQKGSNLVQLAAAGGHWTVIQVLLKNGAAVNGKGGEYGSALQAALSSGDKSTIDGLMQAGADVTAKGGTYDNMLQASAKAGYEEFVRQMLDKIDVNETGGLYGSALQAAAAFGHLEVVRRLLEAGANINMRNGQFGTALQAAASQGHEDLVDLLLEKGCDTIDGEDGMYGSPLQGAASGGHVQIVQSLIDKGADVNINGGKHGNALRAAVYNGQDEVFKVLVKAGADVAEADADTDSLLQIAVERGHESILRLLIEMGVDRQLKPAFYLASKSGKERMMALLIDLAMTRAKMMTYEQALVCVAMHGHERMVMVLIERGVRMDTKYGTENRTAFYWALREKHRRVAEILLEAGADAFEGEWGTDNALVLASELGSEQIVEATMKETWERKITGKPFSTALEKAACHGHQRIVSMILDFTRPYKMRLNFADALRSASSNKHEGIVTLIIESFFGSEKTRQCPRNVLDDLVERGEYRHVMEFLDKQYSSQDGKEKQEYSQEDKEQVRAKIFKEAAQNGDEEIVQFFIEKAASPEQQQEMPVADALHAAVEQGQRSVVELLLKKGGADVQASTEQSKSLLAMAAAQGDPSVVQKLLRAGAKVNGRDKTYGTALRAACEGGHVSIVKALLKAGAKPNDWGGKSSGPLHVAARGGYARIVRNLIRSRADMDALDGDGNIALQQAALLGHYGVVRSFLEKRAKINPNAGIYGNALQAAAYGGHIAVAKLLLSRGASAKTKGGKYGYSLHAAVKGDHRRMISLLLKKGADINAVHEPDGTALCAAIANRFEHLVCLLLASGADVNVNGGKYGNALQLASSHLGSCSMVELLLKQGANINAYGGKYGTALQAAKDGNMKDTVALLTKRGAKSIIQPKGKDAVSLLRVSSRLLWMKLKTRIRSMVSRFWRW